MENAEAARMGNAEAARIAFRPPPFWQNRPELWLAQIESQFMLAGIVNENTKYHCLVSALGNSELSLVSDIIIQPPAENPYQILKQRILDQFTDTEAQKLKSLLQDLQLGDKKPSHLLMEMKNLAAGQLDEKILKTLWLQRLPTMVQQILAISTDNLAKLAQMADGIIAVQPATQYDAITKHQNVPDHNTVIDKLNEVMDRLTKIELQYKIPQNEPKHGTDSYASQGNSPRPRRRSPNRQICYYHTKFGEAAKKCNQPCIFAKPARSNVRATHTVGLIQSRMYIYDPPTGKRFLVDTGADLSIIPYEQQMSLDNSGQALPKLNAANGSAIPTFGFKTLNLTFGSNCNFKWSFLCAKVNCPVLGADFLSHFKLAVHLHSKLLKGTTQDLVIKANTDHKQTWDATEIVNTTIQKLLETYPSLTEPNTIKRQVKHNTKHYIETKGRPVYAKARRLAPEKLMIAKQAFTNMVKDGTCRPSNSPWASPIHMVKKSNGQWRICGDYRQLNKATTPDRYPIPHIQDFGNLLHDTEVYSTLDLTSAYHQIPVAVEDIQKTAVITPFGLYEYPQMPFGLCNAAQTFQRFINEVLTGLDFCSSYIDDILIASNNYQKHTEHLEAVFKRLSEYGIKLNLDKCHLAKESVLFLGHQITKKGITPRQDKIEAIKQFSKPNIVQDLRRFLGMINFYRRFIPNIAGIQEPLCQHLANAGKRGTEVIKWNDSSNNAFIKCKEALMQATLLTFPSPTAELSLMVDASNTALGASLQQLKDSSWEPLAFYSRKLTKAEQNYSAYDRELLAAFTSIKHFKHMLEGRMFILYTDHKPLTYAFKQKPHKASPRQVRHLDYIGQYTTDIRHIAGKENIVADALSRIDTIDCPTSIDYEKIAEEQLKDKELTSLETSTSLKLKLCPLPNTTVQIWCDTSTSKIRPYIPENKRLEVFRAIHNLSHPGIRTTTKMLCERFVWPAIRKDCREWARKCIPCQKAKVSRHTITQHGAFETPSERFTHVHVDIVGPLPPSGGFNYCLTCIDRFSKWPEVIPMSDMTAGTVASALYNGWISRFGTPEKITTDQGRQFESALFKALSKLLGVRHIRTTPYHPASNGLIERFHRGLKASLMTHLTNDWIPTLPTVLLGLRTCLREDSQTTAAQAIYGTNIRLPGDFFNAPLNKRAELHTFAETLRQTMQTLQPEKVKTHGSKKLYFNNKLSDCTHVFMRVDRIRKPLEPPYAGPYKVLKRQNKVFTILVKGNPQVISVDRLKPAFLLNQMDDTKPIEIKTNQRPRSILKTTAQPRILRSTTKKVQFAQ